MITYTIKPHLGRGFHYWQQFLACPRKARLDREQIENSVKEGAMPFVDGNMGVGTLFHAFMELWRSGQLSSPNDLPQVSFEGAVVDTETRYEAERLAVEYMAKFSTGDHGVVWSTEETIAEEAGLGPLLFGAPVWGGQIDLVTRIEKKRLPKIVEQFPVLDGIEPGFLLHDYKTGSAKYGALADVQLNSFQFSGYMLAWNHLHPEQPCQGLLVHNIIKTKQIQIFFTFVPKPGEVEIAALKEFYRACLFNMTNCFDAPFAHEKNCFSIMGICNHWLEGRCARTASRLKVV